MPAGWTEEPCFASRHRCAKIDGGADQQPNRTYSLGMQLHWLLAVCKAEKPTGDPPVLGAIGKYGISAKITQESLVPTFIHFEPVSIGRLYIFLDIHFSFWCCIKTLH